MSANPRVSLFTKTITSKNSTTYSYDNIGRLTQAGADTFTYDKAGNNLNDNALYNILNNQLNSSDIYTITYDSMGNIKTKHNKLTNTTSHYTFNARNQLTQYVQQDENNQTTKTLTYTYDAFNRRVSKTEDNIEQRYLYDGDDIVAILDSSNQVIATITHDESIDTPLSITNANGTFYYHRDHQGSIVALTDSSGQVVESFTYDNHYGTIVDHTKTIETNNPYAYTGRELDTDELYYYRARYYDSQIQRFVSEDSYGYWAGDVNFYRYVYGSPTNFIDPSGHLAFLIPWALVEAAGWAGLTTGIGWSLWDASNKNPGTFASPSISLPWNGIPDSTDKCRREDGTPKQKRRYSPDGTPLQDVDYDHDHGYGSPHVHDWNGKKRSKGRKPVDSDGDVGFDAD